MKLATYRDGTRDGQLVVVSRDLSTAHYATGIADRLQQVLDDWNFLSPQLQDLSETLNHGKPRHAFAFEPQRCMAPLPRAYQWADASAYLNHVELVRAARGAALPPTLQSDPLMYQGGSDDLLGPCDDVVCPSEDYGIDFEAEVGVITGDVPIDESGEPLHLSDIASLSDAINRPSIKQLRQQMMKGERPDFCNSCYRIEDAGGTSVRQFYLRSFGNELKAQLRETLDDGTAAGRISYIDMSLSNNCNLKCRMCNPYASYALKKRLRCLQPALLSRRR